MSVAAAPITQALDEVQRRLSALEASAGLKPGAAPTPGIVAPNSLAASTLAATAASDDVDPRVAAFEQIVTRYGAQLRNVGNNIGGDAKEIGAIYYQLYLHNTKVLKLVTKAKKPDAGTLQSLQAELMELGKPLAAMRNNKDSPTVNLAIAAGEGMPAFTWIFQDAQPVTVVELGRDASEFYNNKVRKESKENGMPDYMTFANTMRDGFNAIMEFVKEHYKLSVSWAGKADYAAVAASIGASFALHICPCIRGPAAAAAESGSASAPTKPANVESAAALQGKLFAELGSIDQSSGKTAGLRHVTKDMKSSANKDAAPAASPAQKATVTKSTDEKGFPTGQPKSALVGNRWIVDHQTDLKEPLHITNVSIKEEVYVFGCRNAVIYIDTKVKGVRIDTCKDVTFVIEAALSGVEVVNSKKIKIQVQRFLPSVAIDKTDGIIVGLSWESRTAQIVTSKSSEMNVTFPQSDKEDADWVEMPIPEQFVTKIQPNNQLTTTISELYTH